MQISPSISASGYLRLDISLEVSIFSGRRSRARSRRRKITRTIQTSVNVPNGDTMVIGGIITREPRRQPHGRALAGDLPIWSATLFRRSTEQRAADHALLLRHAAHPARTRTSPTWPSTPTRSSSTPPTRSAPTASAWSTPSSGPTRPTSCEGFEVPLYRSPATRRGRPRGRGLDAREARRGPRAARTGRRSRTSSSPRDRSPTSARSRARPAMANLAEMLVDAGLSREQPRGVPRASRRESGESLDRVILQRDYLPERDAAAGLRPAPGLRVPRARSRKSRVPPAFVNRVPVQFARNYNLVALERGERRCCKVATCAPLDAAPDGRPRGACSAPRSSRCSRRAPRSRA